MRPFPLLPIPLSILVVAAAVGAGCAEPTRKDEPLSIHVAMEDGLVASYFFAPDWPGLVPVNFTISAHAGGDGRMGIDYAYTHASRPEFDSIVHYTLDKDGAWAGSQWDCRPVYFHERNRACYDYLSGWGTQAGARGAFFGLTLISGLEADGDGIVRRPISYGTRTVEAAFRLEREDDLVKVSAADDATRRLPEPWFDNQEPYFCSIFEANATVLFDPALGLPVRCEIFEEDDGEGWGYSLGWTNANAKTGRFIADLSGIETTLPSAGGVRMPPRDGDQGLIFGFWEALDYAASQDPRVRSALEDDDVTLRNAYLGPVGGSGTGFCDLLCVREAKWQWKIILAGPQGGLDLTVSKNFINGQPVVLGLEEVLPTQRIAPAEGARQIPRFGELWQAGKADRGFCPGVLFYDTGMPFGRESWLEPWVTIGFSPPQGGFIPSIIHRADGSIALWEIAGAVPIERSGQEEFYGC